MVVVISSMLGFFPLLILIRHVRFDGTDLEIASQTKVIGCVGRTRQTILSNLLTSWKLQNGIDLDGSWSVENVIQGLDVLTIFAYLPSRVGNFDAIIYFCIRRLKSHAAFSFDHGVVHWFRWLGVEVAGDDDGSTSCLLFQVLQQVFALFVPQSGQQRSLAGFQMSRGYHQFFTGQLAFQNRRQNDLIALDPPDLNHSALQFPEAEFVLFEKDGAAVGTGVFGQIDARRVWLGEKVTLIVEARQRPLEVLEMVHLLETNDIGVVLDNLFQHPEFPCSP